MSSSIARFLLEKLIGRKHTELFSLEKNSMFPLGFGEGVRERLCFSAPWESFVITPDVLQVLAFERKTPSSLRITKSEPSCAPGHISSLSSVIIYLPDHLFLQK